MFQPGQFPSRGHLQQRYQPLAQRHSNHLAVMAESRAANQTRALLPLNSQTRRARGGFPKPKLVRSGRHELAAVGAKKDHRASRGWKRPHAFGIRSTPEHGATLTRMASG